MEDRVTVGEENYSGHSLGGGRARNFRGSYGKRVFPSLQLPVINKLPWASRPPKLPIISKCLFGLPASVIQKLLGSPNKHPLRLPPGF
jgi:hypothetical protein